MVGQYYGSKEKEQKVASLCRFHGFKQGMFERSLPYASHRPAGRCYCRPSFDELLRYLSKVPSNTVSTRGLRKDKFCYSHWKLSLQGDALRPEKRRVRLSKDDD